MCEESRFYTPADTAVYKGKAKPKSAWQKALHNAGRKQRRKDAGGKHKKRGAYNNLKRKTGSY